MVLFYCLPYNTLYHLRDCSHGVERFALSECILFLVVFNWNVSSSFIENQKPNVLKGWSIHLIPNVLIDIYSIDRD